VKHVSGLHSDPPLLLSHSAASTSCESRLEEQQLTPRELHVAEIDDDDVRESSHRYLLQQTRTPPSLSGQLAGNQDVTLHRVLCSYHQLVAANSAQSAAFVAFPDATLRRTPDEHFCVRAGEDAMGGENNLCRHEIDLIRDSLNDATSRNVCDRRTTNDDQPVSAERWPTATRSTTASLSTSGANLSGTLGRAAHVTFTCDQHDDTPPHSADQVTC